MLRLLAPFPDGFFFGLTQFIPLFTIFLFGCHDIKPSVERSIDLQYTTKVLVYSFAQAHS